MTLSNQRPRSATRDYSSLPAAFAALDLSPIEQARYRDLRDSLRPFCHLFAGKRVLDFGASYGLSAAVLVELGASYVWGVEPEKWRVEKRQGIHVEARHSRLCGKLSTSRTPAT